MADVPPLSTRSGSDRRPVDARALSRIGARLGAMQQPPWLHAEVARRMAERLPLIKRQPQRILDWSSWLGASEEVLAAACPQARQVQVEPLAPVLSRRREARQRPWWSLRRSGPEVLSPDEVEAGSADMLWSNMALHGAEDPPAVLAQWHRALAVDGFLMFSTLGPGTLGGLAELYGEQGWGSPMAPLVDMHDLGDMLVQAGFADPVMDQEVITLTWESPEAALRELRSLGGNADPRRHPGLRTRAWLHALQRALAGRLVHGGRVALEFEVVYGHAFRVAAKPRVQARTEVSLESMREMVRSRRTPDT